MNSEISSNDTSIRPAHVVLPLFLAAGGCADVDYQVLEDPCDALQACYDSALVEPVSTSELSTAAQDWLAEIEAEVLKDAAEDGYSEEGLSVETVCLPIDEVMELAAACEDEADVYESECNDNPWNFTGVDQAFITIGQGLIEDGQECPNELTGSWAMTMPSENGVACVSAALWSNPYDMTNNCEG